MKNWRNQDRKLHLIRDFESEIMPRESSRSYSDLKGGGGSHGRSRREEKYIEKTSRDHSDKYVGKTSRDYSEKSSRDYSEKSSRDYSEKSSRDYYEKSSRDYSEKPSRDYAEKSSKDYSEKPSRDYAEKSSKDYSEKPSRDYAEKSSKDYSEKPSRDYSEKSSRDYSEKSRRSPKRSSSSSSKSRSTHSSGREENIVKNDKKMCAESIIPNDVPSNYVEPITDFDKEKIHKEMEQKLRLALAKEGKIYPPPKPEPSHPIFANDGSFLETFKKMQAQMQNNQQQTDNETKSVPACKRRGGKILKTGVVAKRKPEDASNSDNSKDFWSVYLQEVKKYKSASCEMECSVRALVK